jgi:hypothetical protein
MWVAVPSVPIYCQPLPPNLYPNPTSRSGSLGFPLLGTPPRVKRKENPKHVYFTENDDNRLIEVMKRHTQRPLRCREWHEIAAEFGKFSVRQCRERWHRYLKPPLIRTEFTIPERRDLLKQSLADYGHWERIATRIGNGKVRSPAMVKNMLSNLVPKLRKMGFEFQTAVDIDCLPEVVFQWGYPSPDEQRKLVAEYNSLRERQTRGDLDPGHPNQFSIQAILHSTPITRTCPQKWIEPHFRAQPQ